MKQAKYRTVAEAMAMVRPEAMIVKTRLQTEAVAVVMEPAATVAAAMGGVALVETTESPAMAVAARVMQRTGIVPAVTTSPVLTAFNKLRQRLLMLSMLLLVLRSSAMVHVIRLAVLNTLTVANLVPSIVTRCAAVKILTAVDSATCFMSPSFGSGGTSGRKRKGRNVAQGKAKKMLLMKLPSRQLFQQRRGRPTKNLNRQTRGLQRKDHILHVPFRKGHPPKYINKTIGQLLQS
jgi:hypothetical protein